MQKLEIYQSLWAMELRSPDRPERSHEESFHRVAEAGYDGLCIDPGADEIEEFRALLPLYDRFGLGCMVNAFPYRLDDMLPLLALANEFKATLVNVIGGVMPLTAAAAVPVVERWMDDAEQAGLPLLFETHRDSLLNDLYYTLQLLELAPDMRLCADLSHFVIDREMRAPITATDQAHVERILRQSDCFQGRVANREQVQVQIDFPQHQEWVAIFKGWWRSGMRSWRQRNASNATLVFLCELGPPPYAMTDRNRRELSDRWDEALQIRAWVRDIWRELEGEERASDGRTEPAGGQ